MLFNLMAAMGSSAPGPVPPPPHFIAGGNRSEVPYTYSTITSASNVRQNRLSIQSPAHAGLRDPQFYFANFAALANGGESTTSIYPFNLRAAVEYPLGTRNRLYFGGGNTLIEQLMTPGLIATCALDPAVHVTIPAGSRYWVRIYAAYLNADGSAYTGPSFNYLLNQLMMVGRDEQAFNTTDLTDDRTVVGNMTDIVSPSQIFGPTVIYGQPV